MSLLPRDTAMHANDKVKHLFLETGCAEGAAPECLPHLYVESRIDFSDVRTGFRDTVSLSQALEIYPDESGLLWADDMIRDVDPRRLKPFVPDPARMESLPAFVDADFISRTEIQYLQHLLRSFKSRIYRNFTLNLYSAPGESSHDFIRRCEELLDGPMRGELDSLREVFDRRLGQIVQKYLKAGDSDRLEQARIDSQNKDTYSRYAERVAGLFLQAGASFRPPAASPPNGSGLREIEEKLSSLEFEAYRAIVNLKDSYAEKARSIDEYILHPNLKDIHFVRTCILWMPPKAA